MTKIDIKLGYKMTKLGWIPEEWEIVKFGDACIVKGDYGINAAAVDYSPDLPAYLRITDLGDNNQLDLLKKKSVDDVDSNNFILGDREIVFARTGATVGKTYLHDREENGDYVFAGFLIRFKTDENILFSKYLKLFTETSQYWRWIKVMSVRSGQPGINSKELCLLKIALPPLPEQKKIAQILSTWDQSIEKTQSLIQKMQLRKKGLMQQLLTGDKRLPGFSGEWEEGKLSDVLVSRGKKLDPEADVMYQQIGVRSHKKGIFYKGKVTGKSLGNKRVFWIESNCFIVNIVFAWEHAIAKTSEAEVGMIASHRFPMYSSKEDVLDVDFLLLYFKTPRGKYLLQLASPGGAGRNKTLGKAEFLRLSIPIPSVKEQTAIAQVLTQVDEEIQQTQNYLTQLQQQKKGLMQQLLTGQKRVAI